MKGTIGVGAASITFMTYSLACLCSEQPPVGRPFDIIAGTISAVALVLFWCTLVKARGRSLRAVFSGTPPATLLAIGPYRYIRHPFYASYTLGWLAAFIAIRTPISMLALVTMTSIYVVAARLEEARFASSSLSRTHRDYMARTGMFFPRLWRNGSNDPHLPGPT